MKENRFESGFTWSDYRHMAPVHRQQYTIKREILSVEVGLIGREKRSYPLYLVESMQENRSLLQRMMNLTTIRFTLRDSSRSTVELINVFSDDGCTYERLMDEVAAVQRRLMMRMPFGSRQTLACLPERGWYSSGQEDEDLFGD